MDNYNQENERLIQDNYQIGVDNLKTLVNKYMQRETGSDEIDYYSQQGGNKWLQNGLQTSFETGIRTDSIPTRVESYGHNHKEKVRTKTFCQLFYEAMDDLILKILLIAGIASIIINVIVEEDHRSTAWIEGFAILLSVFIVAFVTALNDLKKEKEFQKLNEEAESGKKVNLIRDGQQIDNLQIGDVLVGDLLILKSGIEIPGDGIIFNSVQMQMDESSMTGETRPMKKENLDYCLQKRDEFISKGHKIKHHDLPSPVIMAGTKVLSGHGKMIIINVGKHSAIGKIKELITSGEDELTPLQMKLEKIARDIGYFGLISAILIFIVLVGRMIIEGFQDNWSKSGMDYVRDILEYFIIAIAILVVAIPEGLPLAVTLSLAFSVNKMMEDKNLVRKLQACETMGGANIICSDKTGTLTRNQMYWTHFWNTKEYLIYDSIEARPKMFTEFTNSEGAEMFINTVILNSVEDPNKNDGNPTEMALLQYFKSCNFEVMQYRDFNKNVLFQAPFTSDRKRMSTIVRLPNNKEFCYVKGASEYIINSSEYFHNLQTNKIERISQQMKKELHDSINHMAVQALRTIGLCYKVVNFYDLDVEESDEQGIFEFEKNGFVLVGICGIKDIIRAEVPESIRKCNIAGIDVKMVTGDNKVTARAIAQEINLINKSNSKRALVLEGPDFLRKIGGVICANCNSKQCDCVKNAYELEKPENKGKKIRKDTIQNQEEFDKIWRDLKVLARSRPEDKYALVVGLRERDNVVAVTGDGTNDAPALKKADVGFAMNIAGTEVAKQAADILIMDDNFASIVQAVKWGRNIYDSIRKFLQFQLTVNVVAVITTFFSAIILKEAIFSAVQMLWINLIMDTLAALALATEPPNDNLLKRHPHSKTEYIISPIMMKHILGHSVFQSIIIFVLVFAGERFLIDPIGQRQLQKGSDLIVAGRQISGYELEDWGNEYSVHYTYNFNIFVFLQMFNLINCRILDDRFNVFSRIHLSHYFIFIFIIIIILQVLFLTFLGRAIRVVKWGLDPVGWAISVVVGSLSLIISVILKLIPMEKCLPGGGKKPIKIQDLDRMTSMSLRRGHSRQFYRNQSHISKVSGMFSDVFEPTTSYINR